MEALFTKYASMANSVELRGTSAPMNLVRPAGPWVVLVAGTTPLPIFTIVEAINECNKLCLSTGSVYI